VLTLVLRRSDQPGFERFVSLVQNPRSSRFRHFETQRALTARFGPTQGAYNRVLGWLRSRGLRLVAGSANHLTLTVAGSRQATARAFKVPIVEYATTSRAGRVYANQQAPVVPRWLAGELAAVDGLSNVVAPSRAPEQSFTEKAAATGFFAVLAFTVYSALQRFLIEPINAAIKNAADALD
jgi:subtilase family serine protease